MVVIGVDQGGCVKGMAMRNRFLSVRVIIIALICLTSGHCLGNPWNGKVVLEAFWWDCENQRYPGDWYTYLAKLCPRLRDMGFDGIWIPPPCKGRRDKGQDGMGYDLFDHYDLGLKYQKGKTATRFGNQDSLLRLIAVAHANGLDVYPDIVLNHCIGGELDPDVPKGLPDKYRWAQFRYTSFSTSQGGRWPKSWMDFHPNRKHWRSDDDWTKADFGPDICYRDPCCDENGRGDVRYMRDQARQWFIWLRKQTGADGVRFDAVKHFPPEVVEDLLYNAMGPGIEYFAVGEYVEANQQRLDAWVSRTNNRCGTFDFDLRNGLVNLSITHISGGLVGTGSSSHLADKSEQGMPRTASDCFGTEPSAWDHGSIRNWRVVCSPTSGWAGGLRC